jgi:arylsulfatase A-like enzyme
MDALAADAVRFSAAVTSAPWTLPAMGTLWTSLYPSVHGATKRSDERKFAVDREHFVPSSALDESRVTLAEVLQANGFATAAFVNGCYPGKEFGFGQGFDLFVENAAPGIRFNVEALLDWLDAQRPKRFFAYIHAIEVHSPYAPLGETRELRARTDAEGARQREALAEEIRRYEAVDFDPGYSGSADGSLNTLTRFKTHGLAPSPADLAHLVALYDRGIAYTDYWVGRLGEELKRRHLYDDTLFIVTADHGEEFRDHGGLEHGLTFYDELLRVPLIMHVPGHAGGRTVDEQVGLIDVMPTILDLVGVPHHLTLQGRSLVPLLDGQALPDRLLYAEADVAGARMAMRSNKIKYVETVEGAKREVYDLANDPHELRNLCADDREGCDLFADTLRSMRAEVDLAAQQLNLPPARAAQIDERTRERLHALGYKE